MRTLSTRTQPRGVILLLLIAGSVGRSPGRFRSVLSWGKGILPFSLSQGGARPPACVLFQFARESNVISERPAICCPWAKPATQSHFRNYHSKPHSGVTELGSLSHWSTRVHLYARARTGQIAKFKAKFIYYILPHSEAKAHRAQQPASAHASQPVGSQEHQPPFEVLSAGSEESRLSAPAQFRAETPKPYFPTSGPQTHFPAPGPFKTSRGRAKWIWGVFCIELACGKGKTIAQSVKSKHLQLVPFGGVLCQPFGENTFSQNAPKTTTRRYLMNLSKQALSFVEGYKYGKLILIWHLNGRFSFVPLPQHRYVNAT